MARLPKITMSAVRLRTLGRLVATLALAYALALQGLLGAMGGAAFAGEIRLANQLGVICTIHGPELAGEAGATPDPAPDPTPGRMACLEHCVLAVGQPINAPGPDAAPLPVERPLRFTGWSIILSGATALYPADGPPPPMRGPPVI